MSFLTTLIWFLIAISILVAIHEFGHYYVAKRCKVKVLRFSIGFGPRLLAFRDRSGTEFALSAIPLGGYVKMLDEREGDVSDDERHMSYNSKSIWQRIAIAAAGPAANIVLAFLLYWAILLNGTVIHSPVIGDVKPGSLAEQAGLAVGQEIISIDGQETLSRRDVALALINRLGETGQIFVVARYPGDSLTYESPVAISGWMRGVEDPHPLEGLGIEFFYPPVSKLVGLITPGSAADMAGFELGDELLRAKDMELLDWQSWVDMIKAHPNVDLNVWVLRDGEEVELTLRPQQKLDDQGAPYGFAGMAPKPSRMPEEMRRIVQYNPLEALYESSNETKNAISFVFLSLKKLIFGEISIKNLSGPVGIAKVAADQAKSGFWAFLDFLAHVSVVLAVLNILPIPMLDGGHILFCLVEWVKGRPLSERTQLLGVRAGMAFLLCVMMIAFYNDILRL